MRRILFPVLSAAIACSRSADAPAPSATLAVHDAWVRAADSGMVTAAYLTVVNPELLGVTIEGASSPFAVSVSLHMTHAMDGMVHMIPLDTVMVASRDSVVFAVNAKHFMVNGLARTLHAGDSLPIVLTFVGGRSLAFNAAVRSP